MQWWGLESIAAADPRDVWAQGTDNVTYARLRHEIDAVRAKLRDQGVGAGTVVAMQVPPSLTMMWWLFALWSEDAQVLLLDARMKPAEARAVLDVIRPGYHVTSLASGDSLAGVADEIDVSIDRISAGLPGDPDLALIQCSSGTTGRPKIVTRTTKSILADVDRHARNPGMPVRGERVLLLSSLAHAFGLAAGVLYSLRVGSTLVLPGSLYPADLLSRARSADVHAILGAPVHFDMLGQAAEDDRFLPSLRLAISCGDVLADAVKKRFVERYGVSIGQAYGMTEVGAVAVDLSGDLQPPAVGKVLPGVELRIVDGELFIKVERNPYLYADDASRYSDGWLRTFDRAELDSRTDVLLLFGRTDSICNLGGLKVDLTEIETVVRAHPEVRHAMVVLPTANSSDRRPPFIEVYVATSGTLTARELTAWCKDRLSDFKIPRLWHIDCDLPRTASGKADRGVRQ